MYKKHLQGFVEVACLKIMIGLLAAANAIRTGLNLQESTHLQMWVSFACSGRRGQR
jgi:hypothetical protein